MTVRLPYRTIYKCNPTPCTCVNAHHLNDTYMYACMDAHFAHNSSRSLYTFCYSFLHQLLVNAFSYMPYVISIRVVYDGI